MNHFSVIDPPRLCSSQAIQWPKLEGLALAIAVSSFADRDSGPTLVVTPDGYTARYLRDDLMALATVPVELFPDWEVLPYDLYSPHPDLISRRLDLLGRLPDLKDGVILCPITTLMQRLPPTQWLKGQSVHVTTQQHLEPAAFKADLLAAGYVSSDQVWQPGQFASRGAVIDLWPMGSLDQPIRIELFDDEVESIRRFDADTQRSIDKVGEIKLLPGREYPFDEAARSEFRRRFRLRFDTDLRRAMTYQEVGQGIQSQGLEQYLPLFFEETGLLLDYLPSPCKTIVFESAYEQASRYHQSIHQRYDQRSGDLERPILKPEELFASATEINQHLTANCAVAIGHQLPDPDWIGAPPIVDLTQPKGLGEQLGQCPGRVLIGADTPARREMILQSLRSQQVEFAAINSWQAFLSGQAKVSVATLAFSTGVALPNEGMTVLSENECFPGHTRTRRQDKRATQDPESLIKSLADLQAGALVVHLEHGIGRYQGLEVLKTEGHVGEYLTIAYADGDLLYVPVADLALVSRYTGQDPDSVALHRLGSDQWKKTRRKAAERIRDVAAELLHLQARRQARTIDPIAADASGYAQFCAGFEYEETQDQLQAIDAVLDDLAKDQPMDRVVCGDVGFGKTEVALRASFVVAHSGAQVAVLAPTTLLADQHYRQFANRFADWPVRVERLTRSSQKNKDTLAGLADGTVDVVIGTHRLLQSDVQFKDLRLVVIDEEQRFGVRQKEQLKAMRAEVNLLTLTATPIPRTLNMSMAGLRELSIIATPPQNRLAVKTFVSQWDAGTIKDAVAREFQRGGQVYYLHNEVKTLPKVASELQALFPDARIGIAHGQMPPNEIEQTMRAFYQRRINLLVCTTIIENGIDVPTANTIIINRADKFGLAQLHQLRGRVGRSHHLAFAHLITPPWATLTTDAKKRLEAIASMEDLGAGFVLATHDLEIRGAGELLGEDQSGQIEAIGFSLYSDLLNRAVHALKNGQEPDLDEPLAMNSDIDLHTTALIPEDYLSDIHQRLVLYKRIAQASNEQSLYDLEVEMIDRFGLLPEPVRHLFTAARLRLWAKVMGIKRLEIGPLGGRIDFTEQPDIKIDEFLTMIQKESHTYDLPSPNRLRIKGQYENYEDRLSLAKEVLSRLSIDQPSAA